MYGSARPDRAGQQTQVKGDPWGGGPSLTLLASVGRATLYPGSLRTSRTHQPPAAARLCCVPRPEEPPLCLCLRVLGTPFSVG